MHRAWLIFLGFLILSFIYGCSEEEQSPLEVVSRTSRISVPEGSLKATLELPGGSKLKPEEMKIIAGEEEISPFATGEFFMPEPEIPQMIMALNKEGKVLFFGVADPRKKEFKIGPESTAVELTFLACMLYALPTELYYEALDMVSEERAVKDLADALDRQFDRDSSSSLEDIIPRVESELAAAVKAINNELAAYMQFMAPPLEISPTQRQSGCQITRNSQDPEGHVKIENYYRRYVYAIARKPGASEALASEFVGMGKPAVSFGTIGQFARGNVDFAPAVETMELPLSPQKDQFQIDIVGPTLRPATTELLWKKEYFISSGATVGMVYILPLIKHIIGSSVQSAFDTGFSTADIYALFGLEVYNLIVDNRELWDAYENRKIIPMIWHTAKLLWESPTFKRIIEVQLRSSIVGGLFEKAFPVLKAIGISVELINAGVATVQWGLAERQVTFDAVEAEISIHITEPSDGSTTKDSAIHIRGDVNNTDSNQIQVSVNGVTHQVAISNGKFDDVVTLTDGDNTIQVSVDGATTQINVAKVKTVVRITEPTDNYSTKEETIHIRGEVENADSSRVQIMINGKTQQAEISNGKFDGVATLTDGDNTIQVSVDGARAELSVLKIKLEPIIEITSPSDGYRTEDRVIHVRGQVENIDAKQGLMTINGREQIIPIENGKFDAVAILTSGDNLIRVAVGGVSRDIRVTNTAPPTTLFAMLTWDEDESDVDLYVTEPDGQTAWFGIYGQRQEPPFVTTNGGELDVDNVEGFGPERYFISSADGDKILPGNYVINVHYYESHGHVGSIHYTVLILKNEQFYDQVEGSISFANKNSASPKDAGKDTSWAHIVDVELISETGTEPGEPGAIGTPDLIVRSLTIEGEATIGQPIRYTVIIENIDAGTAKNFIIKTYTGGRADDLSNNIDQYIVPELKPGETHTRSLSFAPVGYSTSYIVAMVDPDDRIPEAREDNNTGSARIQFHYDEREGMVFIPAGEFEMGDHHGVGDNNERPVHTVYVDGFHMDKYEVTNAQYARFLNEYGKNTDDSGNWLLDIGGVNCRINISGGTYVPESGYEDHPVVEVSCYGAMAYARFYGKRLPTEAEWEKAARGGLVGKKYPWGDEISHQDANYSGTGGRDIWSGASPVGSFPPNGYDLYDMAGNVWEWCADWYDSGYYRVSPGRNPTGPGSGTSRVVRGGGWYYYPDFLRVALRYCYAPASADLGLGFRCVSQD